MYTSKRLLILAVILSLMCSVFTGCSKENVVENQPTTTETQTTSTSDNTNVEDSGSETTIDAENLDSWIGNYSFSENVPPDQNIFYEISVVKENDKYKAKMSIDGFQTMIRLQADVSGDENSIKLIFDKYLPDNTFELYKKGDILLSFENKDSKVYTTWGEIQPIDDSNEKTGVYFSKGQSNSLKNQVITYVNKESGFALDFPKSWEGYYAVNDSEKDYIRVSFTGKSKFGKGFNDETNTYDGLQMFVICSENNLNEFLDGKKKIGTVNGINYYYATGTDYPIGALKDYIDMDMGSNEQEKNLVQSDYDKAREMEMDVEKISNSFRAYP